MGVLVYTELWVGFTAITALLIPGLAQTVVSYRGASLIPASAATARWWPNPRGWRWRSGETVDCLIAAGSVLLAAVGAGSAPGR